MTETFEYNFPNVKHNIWSTQMGGNKFCCNGRLIIGKNSGFFIFTFLLILIPSILFFIYANDNIDLITIIIGIILLLLTLYFFCHTGLMDPGYIPRNDLEKSNIMRRINGSKFCHTCKIWKPLRTKHCRFCDSCVKQFDHHCPWVGTCVALRNYKWFVLFLTALTIYVLFIIVVGVISLLKLADDLAENETLFNKLDDSIKKEGFVAGLSILGILTFPYILILTIYHYYLICKGETTYENLTGTGCENTIKGLENCNNIFFSFIDSHIIK